MSIILYKEETLDKDKKLDFYREITASFEDNGDLLIFGCDIGKFVTKFYDDSGIEYWMRISKDEINKLSLLLHVYLKDLQTGILNAIQTKFSGESCFELIRNFFDEYGIKYKFELWR